jgi:hypothetical protein
MYMMDNSLPYRMYSATGDCSNLEKTFLSNVGCKSSLICWKEKFKRSHHKSCSILNNEFMERRIFIIELVLVVFRVIRNYNRLYCRLHSRPLPRIKPPSSAFVSVKERRSSAFDFLSRIFRSSWML